MAIILEVVLQFLLEFFLQVVFEMLGERATRWSRKRFRERPNPWLAGTGYALFGALAGLASLWLIPELLIHGRTAQLVGLAVTPLLAGAAMSLRGAWRRRRGEELVRLDRFAYGYVFALAMALVRYFGAGAAAGAVVT